MPLPHSDPRRTFPPLGLGALAWVLVHHGHGLICPFLAQTSPCPGCLRPQQKPQPLRGSPSPVPVSQASNVLGRAHPTIWSGPLDPQRRGHDALKHLLAQSPNMDYKLLVSYPHRDPRGGILPPPGLPPDHPTAEGGGA